MGIFSRAGRRMERKKPSCTAVILAAGVSSRMGGEGDKQLLTIGGQPVLVHTLRAFQQAAEIGKVVVVTRSESVVAVQDMCREFGFDKVSEIVVGGATRSHSALNGVIAAGGCDLVAIHDGARPLVTPALIERVFAAAWRFGAAAPGVVPTDTVKEVRDGVITATPDREGLCAIQTPQIFDTALVKGALTRAIQSGISYSDDCAAVEALGMKIRVVDGDSHNMKITTPLDLTVAEALLAERLVEA